MAKNTIIGILILIVIIGLGYYFSKSGNPSGQYNTTVPVTVNETTTTPSTSGGTYTLKADAPVVTTSSAADTSISTASVTGTVNPNGAATTYWFEFGTSNALGTKTSSQAIGSGHYSTPTPGFITGLRANTLYYYRLSANNSFGTVSGTTYTFKTNNTTAPRGSSPTARTNTATDVARTTATINGQVNPNGSATSYWYEYGTDTNFGYVTSYQATNSGVTFMSVPATISGLSPSTKYYFRLNAQNAYGTTNGSILSFTTAGPAQASKPTVDTSNATNISSTDATFNGTINPNGSDTEYWFEYSTDSLLSNLIGSGTPHGTVVGTTTQTIKINVNGLESNTKYYYHLVGKNDYGTVIGDTVSFTTKR